MKLFKNGVGRPSKETLRKRKAFYIGMVAVIIAVIALSGYLIVTKFNVSLNSNDKNVKVPAVPHVGAYSTYTSNKKVLYNGNWTKGNIVVVATSNTNIKIDYYYELSNTIGTRAKVYDNKKGRKVTISDEGVTKIKFKACYKGKCSKYSSPVTIKIDKSKPKLTYTKKGNVITATCTDNLSGVDNFVGGADGISMGASKNKVIDKLEKKVYQFVFTKDKDITGRISCTDKLNNKATEPFKGIIIVPWHTHQHLVNSK